MRPYDLKSGPEARAACQAIGGEQATITSANDNAALLTAATENSVDNDAYVRIGLSAAPEVALRDDSNWRWRSTNQTAAGTYTNWAQDAFAEYGNADTVSQALDAYMNTGTGLWSAANSTDAGAGYVCQQGALRCNRP